MSCVAFPSGVRICIPCLPSRLEHHARPRKWCVWATQGREQRVGFQPRERTIRKASNLLETLFELLPENSAQSVCCLVAAMSALPTASSYEPPLQIPMQLRMAVRLSLEARQCQCRFNLSSTPDPRPKFTAIAVSHIVSVLVQSTAVEAAGRVQKRTVIVKIVFCRSLPHMVSVSCQAPRQRLFNPCKRERLSYEAPPNYGAVANPDSFVQNPIISALPFRMETSSFLPLFSSDMTCLFRQPSPGLVASAWVRQEVRWMSFSRHPTLRNLRCQEFDNRSGVRN